MNISSNRPNSLYRMVARANVSKTLFNFFGREHEVRRYAISIISAYLRARIPQRKTVAMGEGGGEGLSKLTRITVTAIVQMHGLNPPVPLLKRQNARRLWTFKFSFYLHYPFPLSR